jgi:hypothetical protein
MDWPMPTHHHHDRSLHRTPSPEEDIEFYMDDSTAPGADATSQGSPGSASDHMGFMLQDIISGTTTNPHPPMINNIPGAAALAAFDKAIVEQPQRQLHNNIEIETGKSEIDKSSNGSLVDEEKDDGKRRQKRLERNRESARLSRRRRKHYLEDLEKNVHRKAEEVDEARRRHIGLAVAVVQQKRSELICRGDSNAIPILDSHLSRTNVELMLMTTFHSQQIKSFSLPPHMKMILWLSLQPDVFFRGGRAPSERLSAARIGERVRSDAP